MLSENIMISPGDCVCHPEHPELGMGRVQTIQSNHITVNFENAGKLIIDGSVITLEVIPPL